MSDSSGVSLDTGIGGDSHETDEPTSKSGQPLDPPDEEILPSLVLFLF